MIDDSRGAALSLARHYIEIGNDGAALAALDRCDDDALADREYWAVRAKALRGLGRPADAAGAARRGLELRPQDISLLDDLALAELDMDRVADAERTLGAALELAPDQPVLLSHLAFTLARSGRHADARRTVEQALALAPRSPGVLRTRAHVALIADEDPATVRSHIHELLALEPGDQTGLALLGATSRREKDFHRAARELGEAARIDPSNRPLALLARDARVLTHPVLAPARRVWKLGRWRAYAIFLAASTTLRIAHQTALRVVLAVLWLSVVLLTWVGPRILRRREARRYGG